MVEVILQTLEHAKIGHLRRVGDKRKYRIVEIVVDGIHDLGYQQFPQFLPLAIDIMVGAAREINPFERTGGDLFFLLLYLVQLDGTVALHNQRFPRLQFVHVVHFQVEGRLYHRPFRSHHRHLVVVIVECRADAPGVAHNKSVAASNQAAQGVAAVPNLGSPFQQEGNVELLADQVAHFLPRQVFLVEVVVLVLHFPVQIMAKRLQHHKRVGIIARVLSVLHQLLEHLVHVGHVEISRQGKASRRPVVAAQERVHVAEPAFPRSAVSQVADEEFRGKRHRFLYKLDVGELLFRKLLKGRMYMRKYLGDGARTQCPFPENILVARRRLQFHGPEPRSFLATVVLLLHEEIHLVEPVLPAPVFFIIIVEGFEESDYRNPAFVL